MVGHLARDKGNPQPVLHQRHSHLFCDRIHCLCPGLARCFEGSESVDRSGDGTVSTAIGSSITDRSGVDSQGWTAAVRGTPYGQPVVPCANSHGRLSGWSPVALSRDRTDDRPRTVVQVCPTTDDEAGDCRDRICLNFGLGRAFFRG